MSTSNNSSHKKVTLIYTGGTVGMAHLDNNPLQPLRNVPWDSLETYIPVLKRIPIDINSVSIEQPIDSSQMRPEHWVEIANIIQKNYIDSDGFVILHGTDTLTYTASALSFMFENLSKPIVLTGSQLPLGSPRSDALQNVLTSVMIAASIDNYERKIPVVPEVCIFFGDELMRGNRTRKFSTKDYRGFISPNYPILGRAGEYIEIFERNLRKLSSGRFFVDTRLETNVISFNIFPGTSAQVLRSIFEINDLKGVILNTYGAGNAPTDKVFLDIINWAVNSRRIVVVNVTQCPQGEVETGLYETNARLMDQGVVSGLDMTTEAALCKLSSLLGKGYPPETVSQYMQIDQRGEMSSLPNADFGSEALNEKGVYSSHLLQVTGAAALDAP